MKIAAAIQDFFSHFSLEVTPKSAKKMTNYRDIIHPKTPLYITWLAGAEIDQSIDLAKRLHHEGFQPIPHLSARAIANQSTLAAIIQRFIDAADVNEFLIIAGALDRPVGNFDSSIQLLETGLFDRYGIKRIGVAGHPEGSPDITEEKINQALQLKNAFAKRSDAAFYLMTQFCFSAEPIIAWDRCLQTIGNRLPIHVGLPGLTTLQSLISHAKACGIGPSMRMLTQQARQLSRLLTIQAPCQQVIDLAIYKKENPNCGIDSVHWYPLGSLTKTAQWAYALQDGRFHVDPHNQQIIHIS